MGALPQKTVEYNGFITEGKRWADYQHRADDVFICTPGKNGTTWTQAIVTMLIFGKADIDVQPGNISPWYDSNFMPPEAVNGMFNAQTQRRSLKTHTPLDGIPYFAENSYIAVYRDPRDAFFSMAQHMQNMNHNLGDLPPQPADPRDSFVAGCEAPYQPGVAEQMSLAASMHHLKSFWDWRHLPNIHLFHYADMKRDRLAAIKGMARAIGVSLPESTYEAIANATSFENMRAKASQFAPGAGGGVWKKEEDFFRKGRQGEWREIFGERENKAFEEAIAKNLPADAGNWLLNGGPLPV